MSLVRVSLTYLYKEIYSSAHSENSVFRFRIRFCGNDLEAPTSKKRTDHKPKPDCFGEPVSYNTGADSTDWSPILNTNFDSPNTSSVL